MPVSARLPTNVARVGVRPCSGLGCSLEPPRGRHLASRCPRAPWDEARPATPREHRTGRPRRPRSEPGPGAPAKAARANLQGRKGGSPSRPGPQRGPRTGHTQGPAWPCKRILGLSELIAETRTVCASPAGPPRGRVRLRGAGTWREKHAPGQGSAQPRRGWAGVGAGPRALTQGWGRGPSCVSGRGGVCRALGVRIKR